MANDLNQCGDSKKRTPDEIKKGLECNDCKSCPYSEYNNNDGDYRCGEVEGDALSYIQQLEADNAQLKAERDEVYEAICTHCQDFPCREGACYWYNKMNSAHEEGS